MANTHESFYKEICKYITGEVSIENEFLENKYLETLAWAWTEFHDTDLPKDTRGKFISEYWSEKALMFLSKKLNGPMVVDDYKNSTISTLEIPFSLVSYRMPGLHAEHVITKSLFIETMKELKDERKGVPEKLKRALEKRFFSCVITSSEAKDLGNEPYDGQSKNILDDDFKCWYRYCRHNELPKDKIEDTIIVYKCNISYKKHGIGHRWLVSIDHMVNLEE